MNPGTRVRTTRYVRSPHGSIVFKHTMGVVEYCTKGCGGDDMFLVNFETGERVICWPYELEACGVE